MHVQQEQAGRDTEQRVAGTVQVQAGRGRNTKGGFGWWSGMPARQRPGGDGALGVQARHAIMAEGEGCATAVLAKGSGSRRKGGMSWLVSTRASWLAARRWVACARVQAKTILGLGRLAVSLWQSGLRRPLRPQRAAGPAQRLVPAAAP